MTVPIARYSHGGFEQWAFAIVPSRPNHHGRMDTLKGSSVRFCHGDWGAMGRTGMPRPWCATNIPTRKEVWSCARDEGRPLASGDQELDANRCKLLPLRAVVVSVAEEAGPDPAVVCLGETSE